MVIAEYYMLAVMAYDRYMAICNPLITARCPKGSAFTWLLVHIPTGFLVTWWKPCGHTTWPSVAPMWHTSIVLTHPSFDSPALTLIFRRHPCLFVVAGFNLSNPLLIILISYIFILTAILRMSSAEGRHKAFSTCGSHLAAVTVLWDPVLYVH